MGGSSLIVSIGKKLRPHVDDALRRYSEVPDVPLLDPALFGWTAALRRHWRDIRDEALAVMERPEDIPTLDAISPDHRRIAPKDMWRSFFLHGYGNAIPGNIARCPHTAALVDHIPGLNSAFFSILAPGTHIPRHRGVTKGLLTCHLGLRVPAGRCEMEVGGRTARWCEGEALVFDDTFDHEVWNETDETRIVLLIQFARPLRQPGRAVADAFLWGVRHSSFVRQARANVAAWSARAGNEPYGTDGGRAAT